MPIYRTNSARIDEDIAQLEAGGEVITQVLTDTDNLPDGLFVVTQIPKRAAVVSRLGETETRA